MRDAAIYFDRILITFTVSAPQFKTLRKMYFKSLVSK